MRTGSVAVCTVALTLSALVAGPAARALEEPPPSVSPSVGVTPAPSPDPSLEPSPDSTVTSAPEPRAILPGSVKLEGSPASGRSIQAVVADWEPDVAVSFQWLRNGVPVDGATSASHLITAADAGVTLNVRVTGAREGSESVHVMSGPLMVPDQLSGSTPTIAGSAVQGGTVTALAGAWPAGATLSYQWLRNGTDIAGATQPTYVLTAADGGQKVSVRVTGTLAGHLDAVRTSAQVLVLRTLTTAAPKLTGTVKVGSVLTAQPGAWVAGTSFTYQWLRNGAPIAGAVAAGYKLGPSDAARTIAVRVTGTKAGYAPASRASGAVTVPRVLAAAVPTYTGKALLGTVLAAKNGAWTAGTTFRYQWYRNGAAIAGGTRSTYTLASADLGARLTLRVSGSKAGYSPETRLSGKSGVIRRPAPVLWRQNDPRWANIRVGIALLGPSGCVPTATAMALWSEGIKTSPYGVAVTMNRLGDYNRTVSGAGSRSIVAAARYYGVKATPITNVAALRASLKSGHSVVALMRGPGSITWPGTTHAITLSGYSANGSTYVRNPYAGTVNDWYHTDTLWFYQSLDSFDRNAGAVFWQIG
ncbi:C39 family peptidase [Arthrobacter woluwensis]|uniref:Peptidase_C39 like family protein n=1 Tax=Arthrobacter woluwensis TaxID=156980 RepID=A0A1H4LJC9_9MICC|nr:C39 family peptidase [Arthrobacter woluwensis]SEB70626.1 Peptidase_C39 like family protein [Arthrobacter woluwensis]